MRRIHVPVVAQLLGGLAAVLVTTVVMSSQISDRSSFANAELHGDVMERWGAPIVQPAPSVRAVESGAVFTTLERIPLASQEVSVTAEMNYRKRGLVYFSGFDFTFNGTYLVTNHHTYAIDIAFVFPINLEKNRVLLSDLSFRVDDRDERIDMASDADYLLWTGRLGEGGQVAFSIAFRGRGLDSFLYVLDPELPARNFVLDIDISGGNNFDYAQGVVPASSCLRRDGGVALGWEFSSLESGVPVGVILPSEKSFDSLLVTMIRRSWVGFLLFFLSVQAAAFYRRRPLNPLEGLLVAAGYTFFFVLLPYLAAFMSFYVAYVVSLLVIGGLLISYLQRLVEARDAWLLLGALAASLAVPTMAVVLEGYTGLVYTLEILSVLVAAMWFTTRPACRDLLVAAGLDADPKGEVHAQP